MFHSLCFTSWLLFQLQTCSWTDAAPSDVPLCIIKRRVQPSGGARVGLSPFEGESGTTADRGLCPGSYLRMASGRRQTAERRHGAAFVSPQSPAASFITAAGLIRGVCEMRVVRGSNEVKLMKIISPVKQLLLHPSLKTGRIETASGAFFFFFKRIFSVYFANLRLVGSVFQSPKCLWLWSYLCISDLVGFGSIFFVIKWTLCQFQPHATVLWFWEEKGWFGLTSPARRCWKRSQDSEAEAVVARVRSWCGDGLTLHRRARGLREERDEQQIDEVDEGQGIVPEQASCRDRNKRKKKQNTFHRNQWQQ